MFIDMKKWDENKEYVWYSFEVDCGGELYINEMGKERYKTDIKKGLFKFGKLDDTIIFEISKTDHFFLQNPDLYKMGCWMVMQDCKRKNNFPQTTCYACG